MTWVWVWLSVALVVVPLGSSAPPAWSVPDEEPAGESGRRRGGPVIAAVAAGSACVALGGASGAIAALVVVAPAVFVLLRWNLRRSRPAHADRTLALVLDLCAAALRGGCPLGAALRVAAPAAQPALRDALLRVSGLLALGAPPEEAWRGLPPGGPLAAVGPVAVRSAASGMRLADAFERVAAETRAEARSAAEARAHRAGIWAMAPLGACFLPSFVCLGIVPVVIGIARTASGVLP